MSHLSLQLKRAELINYDDYYAIRAEKLNLFWTGYQNPPNYTNFKEWYTQRLQDQTKFLYLLFENSKCVGSLNIDLYSDFALIGYSVKQNNEGKGLGTFIVENAIQLIRENKEINNIKAWINYQNIGSIRVVQKNGFKKSNVSEKRKRFGKEEDYHQYSLTL